MEFFCNSVFNGDFMFTIAALRDGNLSEKSTHYITLASMCPSISPNHIKGVSIIPHVLPVYSAGSRLMKCLG